YCTVIHPRKEGYFVGYFDWVVTVTCYKAVHLAEGLLVRKGFASGNHHQRNQVLKRYYTTVWVDYHPLYNQSRVARFWCVPILPANVANATARLAAVETTVAGISRGAHGGDPRCFATAVQEGPGGEGGVLLAFSLPQRSGHSARPMPRPARPGSKAA